MKLSLAQIRKKNKEAGYKWFDKSEMEFFGTVIETQPNIVNIFITSEWYDFEQTERRYSLRWFNPKNNRIETLGEYLGYRSMDEVKQARRHFTKTYDEWEPELNG